MLEVTQRGLFYTCSSLLQRRSYESVSHAHGQVSIISVKMLVKIEGKSRRRNKVDRVNHTVFDTLRPLYILDKDSASRNRLK